MNKSIYETSLIAINNRYVKINKSIYAHRYFFQIILFLT